MTEISDTVVYIVVGAIVVEGIALMVLTYLMWKSAERASRDIPTDTLSKDDVKD